MREVKAVEDPKIVRLNQHEMRCGMVNVSSHSNSEGSEISVFLMMQAASINLHLSKEEGRKLAASLEDVIAALDAKETAPLYPDHDDLADGCMVDGVDDYGSVQ